jgi:hypothetical protein
MANQDALCLIASDKELTLEWKGKVRRLELVKSQ